MDVDIKSLLRNEASLKSPLHAGKEVEGRLIGRNRTKLYVDLSPWGTGVIYKVEFIQGPAARVVKNLSLGSLIKARVSDPENEEGYVELSLQELSKEAAIENLIQKAKNKETLTGKVVEANKGGLMVQVEGMVGFLPSSQLAPEHYPRAASGEAEEIFKKLQSLIGEELRVRILTIDIQKQSLILSEKVAAEKDIQQRLARFKEGDIVSGEITGVTDFGAFIRFGKDVEGLAHISELDWRLISHPKDLLKVGDKVRAKIIKIENNEVSLSLKALKEDPWQSIGDKYPIGTKVKATIKELHPFGAFAFITEHIHGLVHISQFGSPKRMEQALQAGKTYNFEITSLDPKEHRMGLKLITGGAKRTKVNA